MEALRMFENRLGFTKNINKQYSKDFAQTGAKIGNTITVRKPWRPVTRNGPAINIQNVNEEMVPLVLNNQTGVDFTFSTTDLTLTVDDFAERYLRPAIVAVANQVDIGCLTLAAQSTYNAVGVPGTTPATSLLYMQGKQKIEELSAPQGDRHYYINPAAEPVIVDYLKGLFQSSERIKEQYDSGEMGYGFGGNWHMAQNILSSTTGAQGGTPLVNGANQTGSSLVTNGWSNSIAGLMNVGDVFTIAGVYKVNPITKLQSTVLMQFVVTATAKSDASGNSTLQISPSITTSGSLQTVSGSPAQGAALTLVGAAGSTCANNLITHKDAFTLGCADMELPQGVHFAARATDEQSGLSIRIIRAYDINSDQIPCRLDILWGAAALRPEWACRIMG